MVGATTVLVSSSSATQSRPWETDVRYTQAMNRNHSDLVKFSFKDQDYVVVLEHLRESSRSAKRVIRPRFPHLESSPESEPEAEPEPEPEPESEMGSASSKKPPTRTPRAKKLLTKKLSMRETRRLSMAETQRISARYIHYWSLVELLRDLYGDQWRIEVGISCDS